MSKGKFEEEPKQKHSQKKHRKKVSPAAKAWEIIKSIFTWIILLAAVAMMIFTIISVNTFDRNDRALFGYKAFIVRSDSMSATDFSAGDLVLVKEVDPATLKPGDIIAFRSADPNSFGEVFTHKIRDYATDAQGNPGFITYGTTTGIDDQTPAPYTNVMGKYQFSIPKVGAFFTFLKTVPGYICCILLPFLLLIVLQGVNSIKLFRQYKEEQMAELEAKRKKEMDEMAAEREKLAAEREESQRMLEELQKLRSQYAESAARGQAPHDPSV